MGQTWKWSFKRVSGICSSWWSIERWVCVRKSLWQAEPAELNCNFYVTIRNCAVYFKSGFLFLESWYSVQMKRGTCLEACWKHSEHVRSKHHNDKNDHTMGHKATNSLVRLLVRFLNMDHIFSVTFCPEMQLYLLEMEFFLRLTNDRMKGQWGSLFIKEVLPSPWKVRPSVLMSVRIKQLQNNKFSLKRNQTMKKCTRGRQGEERRNCDYMLLQH